MSLAATLPLTVYYDASCPLCRKEMHTLRDHDRHATLQLVDCSADGFRDAEVERAGLRREDLLRLIHARDADGRWFVGVDVFVLAYRAVGIEAIAGLWSNRALRPVWDRLYPWVARHRMGLSKIGVTTAFGWVVEWFAARALARSQACRDGVCELPVNKHSP
jgi:predicted DCC family thiol-disulfide oxidoreductase YuxK